MVLIISSEDDQSTNDVIDWLIHYNIKFVRVSHLNNFFYKNLSLNDATFDVVLNIDDAIYNLQDFKVCWYRRSFLNVNIKPFEAKNNLRKQIRTHLANETYEIHRFVKRYLEINSINKHNDIFLNKLEVLQQAAARGFRIPNTLITDNKADLLHFYNRHKSIVTKNFSQGIFISVDNKVLGNSTRLIDSAMMDIIPNNFHYTLFQENIEKIVELRIFFLDNKFYSSAIFSQNNEKTKLDFRNYDFEKPNRTPPFLLPKNIKEKLTLLMQKLNLNSGSIDILISKEKEYVFLEVNPIGQFSQVSIPCNFYIEKKIAKQLKKRQNGVI